MCAAILREREERQALLRGACRAAGAVLNVNPNLLIRSFDEYTGLMARRDLDVDALREHIDELRRAHASITRRERDKIRLLSRLDSMGEYADRIWGTETSKTPTKTPGTSPPRLVP